MVETGAEVNAVSEADTPLPIPTDCTADVALEDPPKLVCKPGSDVDFDPLRSSLALALGLALLVIEVEVAVSKRPDVSGLLEITDAEAGAGAETLWLRLCIWLADADKLTGALGKKDVAVAFGGAAALIDVAEAESEAESEIVGAPSVLPNAADADAEPTTLELLCVTEGEKPEIVAAPGALAVNDSLTVVNVACVALALALALCRPVREPVLELDEPRDALALAPDVVAVFVFVFAVVAEIEAVTDSAPLLLELVPPASVVVLSKLALARAAEDEDDLSGALVEVKAKVVGVVVAVDELVVELAEIIALELGRASPCAVLARPDSLEWSITDAEEKEVAAVVRPPAALELDISVPDFVLVNDTVAVAVAECTDILFRPKRRYIQLISKRTEQGK